MLGMDPDRESGPWQGRVRFGPGGAFAYRPGEVLVRAEMADHAEEVLQTWADEHDEVEIQRDEEPVGDAFVRFVGAFQVQDALERLHGVGILGQVNHVLFATCCPPHPAHPCADDFYAGPFYASPFYASPFYASPFYASPFYASPFYASPFYASPFYASPFYASAAGSCGCGCGPSGNPFYASPFYASPFYASGSPSPFANPAYQLTGARSSSAKPASAPKLSKKGAVQNPVRVAILDTGWAEVHQPNGLPKIKVTPHGGDRPDEDGDGFLDPAAGHGTFIAGVIEQLSPGCDIEVIEVLRTYGDGDEAKVAKVLHALAQRPKKERPHLVNLSFGGYSPLGMAALATAIEALQKKGTVVVASAGNDGTCLPMYPAALPQAVGVAALEQDGSPASFTNYGPWVNASAVGADVVSLFYDGFNGAGPPEKNYDPDYFQGWALWSGSSFAAPRVVAALAREVGSGATPQQAVKKLIDNEKLPRHPMLGTEVNPA